MTCGRASRTISSSLRVASATSACQKESGCAWTKRTPPSGCIGGSFSGKSQERIPLTDLDRRTDATELQRVHAPEPRDDQHVRRLVDDRGGIAGRQQAEVAPRGEPLLERSG